MLQDLSCYSDSETPYLYVYSTFEDASKSPDYTLLISHFILQKYRKKSPPSPHELMQYLGRNFSPLIQFD